MDIDALVLSITDKRAAELNVEILKRIKSFARSGDSNVEAVFQLLWSRLHENNSQVRLLALLVCHELFKRSRHFRTLLTSRFQQFLDMVIGLKASTRLPPPKENAAVLKKRAIELIQAWDSEFGSFYSQLGIGCRYLRDVLKQDIAPEAGSLAPRPPSTNSNHQRIEEEEEESWRRCEAILNTYESSIANIDIARQYGATSLSMLLQGEDGEHVHEPVSPSAPFASGAGASSGPHLSPSNEDPRVTVPTPPEQPVDSQPRNTSGDTDGAREPVSAMPPEEGPSTQMESLEDLEFEEVVGARAADDDSAMALSGFAVAEPLPAAEQEGQHALSKECRDTLMEALSEAYRSIQKHHMPKLLKWLADLRLFLARARPAQGIAAEQGPASLTADPHAASTSAPSTTAALGPHSDRATRASQAHQRLSQTWDALSAFCVRLQSSEALFEELQRLAEHPRSQQSTPQPSSATVRRVRGRNERLHDSTSEPSVPNIYERIRELDPAAPLLTNPYTISTSPAPSRAANVLKQATLTGRQATASAAAVQAKMRPTGAAGGRGGEAADGAAASRPPRASKDSTAGRLGVASSKPSMPKSLIQEIARRAPILPAGDYLKLWESEETQMEHVRQHMQSGQIYNHWGPVRDDVQLDRKAVQDILAVRPAFYEAPLAGGAKQQQAPPLKDDATARAAPSQEELEALAHTTAYYACQSDISNTALQETDVPSSPPDGRRSSGQRAAGDTRQASAQCAQRNDAAQRGPQHDPEIAAISASAGPRPEDARRSLHSSAAAQLSQPLLDASAAGLSRGEMRAAEREYNIGVLARAAMAEVPEPEDQQAAGDGDRARKRRGLTRAGVMKKLRQAAKE